MTANAWALDCSPMIETADGFYRDADGAVVTFPTVEAATDFADATPGLDFHCPTRIA